MGFRRAAVPLLSFLLIALLAFPCAAQTENVRVLGGIDPSTVEAGEPVVLRHPSLLQAATFYVVARLESGEELPVQVLGTRGEDVLVSTPAGLSAAAVYEVHWQREDTDETEVVATPPLQVRERLPDSEDPASPRLTFMVLPDPEGREDLFRLEWRLQGEEKPVRLSVLLLTPDTLEFSDAPLQERLYLEVITSGGEENSAELPLRLRKPGSARVLARVPGRPEIRRTTPNLQPLAAGVGEIGLEPQRLLPFLSPEPFFIRARTSWVAYRKKIIEDTMSYNVEAGLRFDFGLPAQFEVSAGAQVWQADFEMTETTGGLATKLPGGGGGAAITVRGELEAQHWWAALRVAVPLGEYVELAPRVRYGRLRAKADVEGEAERLTVYDNVFGYGLDLGVTPWKHFRFGVGVERQTGRDFKELEATSLSAWLEFDF